MSYLDDLAIEIERRVPPERLPDSNTRSLFRLYALLALVKGDAVTLADVHDAWAVWMLDRDPHHRSIKPFSDLDAETQGADEPFADAIREVAARLDRAHDATE
jgi:hypothetical protein